MKMTYYIPTVELVQIEFKGVLMTSPPGPDTDPTSEPKW